MLSYESEASTEEFYQIKDDTRLRISSDYSLKYTTKLSKRQGVHICLTDGSCIHRTAAFSTKYSNLSELFGER